MKVEFDPPKAESNLRKHKVGFDEAATCLLDPRALVIEDDDSEASEARFILLGMSAKGRLLVVVYALREENIRLISARKPTKREAKFYA